MKERLLTLLHLKQALVKDFNGLYVREYSTEWQIQRLIRELELRDLELTNTEKYLTERDIKTRQATLREVGEWLDKNTMAITLTASKDGKSYSYDGNGKPHRLIAGESFVELLAKLKQGSMPNDK